MNAVRVHTVVEKDGEVTVTGLPFKEGEAVEVIVLSEPIDERPVMTAHDLLNSGLVGLWKERIDIEDSAGFARQLRDKAQRRWTDNNDSAGH